MATMTSWCHVGPAQEIRAAIPRRAPEALLIGSSDSQSDPSQLRDVVKTTIAYPCRDPAKLRRLNAWSADDARRVRHAPRRVDPEGAHPNLYAY